MKLHGFEKRDAEFVAQALDEISREQKIAQLTGARRIANRTGWSIILFGACLVGISLTAQPAATLPAGIVWLLVSGALILGQRNKFESEIRILKVIEKIRKQTHRSDPAHQV